MGKKETNFKQTDIGLIPHDWEVVSLGEHSRKIGSGKTPRGGEAVYTLSGIPFVRSQNVGYGRMHLKGISYISEALHNEQKSSEIDVNDILLNITGASIGRCSVADKYVVGGNINQHVCIIRLAPSSFISSYLCNFLLSNNGQEQIQLLQSGGSREGINFGQVGNIKVPLPPLKEQKRIAEVLGHFDEHIDNLAALLEKRKQVKAATMHALLSGATRLPGFTQPWEERSLSELFSFVRGNGLSKSVVGGKGKYPCILYGQLFTTYKENIQLVASYTDLEEGVLSKKGDVLIPASTTTSGEDLATASALQYDGVKLGGDIIVFRPKQVMDSLFMAYIIRLLKDEITALAQGITIVHISGKRLLDLEVMMPTSVEEQSTIVDILSNMDRGIETLEQEIMKYRQMKEGAMEELLTGKIRLS